MSLIEYKFYSFKIEDEGRVIQMVPIQFYNVEFSVRYVVMYKLSVSYKNEKDTVKNMESIVPYYISNGQTNKLRANMLFPFMCYSDWNNQGICPFYAEESDKKRKKSGQSLLLKYLINPNYKYSKLEEIVLHNFLNKEGPENIETKHKQYKELITKSINFSRGLPSILPRIHNLLDFVICIINDNIIQLNPHEVNIKCFRPLSDKDDPEYIDMDKCNHTPEKLTEEDDYRFILISILHKYANMILKNHILDIEPLVLEAVPITKEEFNLSVNVCDTIVSARNMASYGFISIFFKQNFRIILDKIISTIDEQNMKENDHDLLFFDSILNYIGPSTHPNNIYRTHMEDFKMDCSISSEGDK
jgi:hypothetical protein